MKIMQPGSAFFGRDRDQSCELVDSSVEAGFMTLELAHCARRIAGEIGDEGLKPGVFFDVEAGKLFDGFRFGLARKRGEQFAHFGVRLIIGCREQQASGPVGF